MNGPVNDCPDMRGSLGVYVLGAIEPAERSRLEAHLEGCPACRDELAGMAGLPALLGRVDEAQLGQLTGPPPELLDGLLARAAERRTGRAARAVRWARARRHDRPAARRGPALGRIPLVAAACLLLLVGVLTGGLFFPGGGGERAGTALPTVSPTAPPTAPPTQARPTAPGAPAGERITAEDPNSRIRGVVILHRKLWGTQVELYLSGVPKGSHCRLQATARDGRRDALGSWSVPYDKGYGEYGGSTMFQRGQLFSIEITTTEGRPLLTIPT